MKKTSLIILIIILIFAALAVTILFVKNKKAAISQNLNEKKTLSLAKKDISKINFFPVLSLSPTKKRNVLDISIDNQTGLWSKYPKVNYEFMYNSSRGPRGLMGTLTSDNLTEKLFLGSESSGHKVYDTGITNGQMTVYLEDNQGNNFNLGNHYFVVGGYKYLNKWSTDGFNFSTAKKNRQDFVILVLNNSQTSKTNQSKYIIFVQPEKLTIKGRLTLKNVRVQITSLTLTGQKINFKTDPASQTLTFNLTKGGIYYLK